MNNLNWVHVSNVQDELLSMIYSEARVLIMPSIAEGFGLPVVEAISCGCPILLSSVGPFHEIVSHLEIDYASRDACIRWTDPIDPLELMNGIRYFTTMNESQRVDCGHALSNSSAFYSGWNDLTKSIWSAINE